MERVEGEEAVRTATESRHLTLAHPRLHGTSFYVTWISLLDSTLLFFFFFFSDPFCFDPS